MLCVGLSFLLYLCILSVVDCNGMCLTCLQSFHFAIFHALTAVTHSVAHYAGHIGASGSDLVSGLTASFMFALLLTEAATLGLALHYKDKYVRSSVVDDEKYPSVEVPTHYNYGTGAGIVAEAGGDDVQPVRARILVERDDAFHDAL